MLNGETHGHTKGGVQSREYRAWASMKTRVTNRNRSDFRHYGGRGIKIDECWLASFEAFYHDMGPCPTGATLERIDTNGPYGPDNCRWATRSEQSLNTRVNRLLTHDDITLPAAEWARIRGLNYYSLRSRLKLGWPVGAALDTPIGGVATWRPARTTCRFGHEFTQANTYVTRTGRRRCRTCGRIQKMESYWRIAEKAGRAKCQTK